MNVSFAREDELCAVLASSLDGLLLPGSDPSHIRTLEQRAVGKVIPDFIYVRSNRLLPPGTARGLTTIEATIVATLVSCTGLAAEAIAKRLYSKLERISPYLRSLERAGVLARSSEELLVVRRGVLPKATRLVAVEAKLHRWRDAVRQAETYLAFANQSYVALPDEIIRDNPSLREEVSARALGIIGVGPKGARIVQTAPKHLPRTADWVWLLSRTVPFSRP